MHTKTLSLVLSVMLLMPGRAHVGEIGEWIIKRLDGFQGQWCTAKVGNRSTVTTEIYHRGPCGAREAELLITDTVIREWNGRDGSVCWPTGNVLMPAQESTTDRSFFKFHCVLTNGPPGRRYENDTGWRGEIKDGLLHVHWRRF